MLTTHFIKEGNGNFKKQKVFNVVNVECIEKVMRKIGQDEQQ